MTNEEFIVKNLCNDCNDKATCSVSCYWFDHMKRLAEWKDEQLKEYLENERRGYQQKKNYFTNPNEYDYIIRCDAILIALDIIINELFGEETK